MMYLIVWGICAFVLSFFSTLFIKRVALYFGVVDKSDQKSKVHNRSTALLGGVSIFIAIAVCVIGILLMNNLLTSGEVRVWQYVGVLLGGLVIMIGGVLDDCYKLPPHLAIIAPFVAAVLAILFGVQVEKLTNPFGGYFYLESWQSDLLVVIWLMIVMYTTKFLDGLDGLATSVSSVGVLMIMLLALTTAYYQPDVSLFAAVTLGAFVGFLFWNIHPASIFLGEGGSLFVGFMLGVLAVISGGKVATALLVLGIPLLDVVWVVFRRLRQGGIRRVVVGDRGHLHHRLLALGWGHTRIVALYVAVASAFGMSALFLQSKEKLVALMILVLIMGFVAFFFVQKRPLQKLRS
jgi:UDP-GlcNAc:undecaprenyl-phosphate GlcNAc-1-phosphate transferase